MTSVSRGNQVEPGAEATTTALAHAIGRFAKTDGDHTTPIPALSLHRRLAPTMPVQCIYGLGLIVMAQGSKQVLLGDRVLDYGPGQTMLSTVDVLVTTHVTQASLAEPFLGLMLGFDPALIMQLASEMGLPPPQRGSEYRALSIESLDPLLGDALVRLVKLLDEPILLPRLAPLIQREIVIRLLTGPHALQLRHLVMAESPNQQIARTLTWLKQHFAQPLRIDDLAERAHMSPSTFRQHFRAVTGMSPLQFQKRLRLQEARQVMLNQDVDAGQAARLVGYESASQFSREYTRLFGTPPQRDVQQIRQGEPPHSSSE